MSQKPSVARIVHYQSYGTPKGEYVSKPIAAIVTQVHETAETMADGGATADVGLCIFNPTGLFFNPRVPYSEEPKPGHWSWPPRV